MCLIFAGVFVLGGPIVRIGFFCFFGFVLGLCCAIGLWFVGFVGVPEGVFCLCVIGEL